MARMRKASRPRSASVGTRSRKAMSSSMLIRGYYWNLILSKNQCPRFGIRLLRDQFVAAAFRHQDGRGRGVALDLLAQPVNVSLERVGGDARVVTPDFLQ